MGDARHYRANRDAILKQKREYYLRNKERIAAYRAVKRAELRARHAADRRIHSDVIKIARELGVSRPQARTLLSQKSTNAGVHHATDH